MKPVCISHPQVLFIFFSFFRTFKEMECVQDHGCHNTGPCRGRGGGCVCFQLGTETYLTSSVFSLVEHEICCPVLCESPAVLSADGERCSSQSMASSGSCLNLKRIHNRDNFDHLLTALAKAGVSAFWRLKLGTHYAMLGTLDAKTWPRPI